MGHVEANQHSKLMTKSLWSSPLHYEQSLFRIVALGIKEVCVLGFCLYLEGEVWLCYCFSLLCILLLL